MKGHEEDRDRGEAGGTQGVIGELKGRGDDRGMEAKGQGWDGGEGRRG